MTFKESINRFKVEYNNICRANGIAELKLDEKEILYYLSKACTEYSFLERLVEKKLTINLVAGQTEYNPFVSVGDSPDPFISVQTIKINGCVIEKTSLEDITQCLCSGESAITGLPYKWTVHYTNANRRFIVFPAPDKSYTDDSTYQLEVFYWEKEYDYSGSAENTYKTLDFTSSTYGGSFQTPTEWDSLIVQKALTNVLPINLRAIFTADCDRLADKLKRAKPIYQNTNLPYHLGI